MHFVVVVLVPPCEYSVMVSCKTFYFYYFSFCFPFFFFFFDLKIGLEVTEVAVSGLPMNPSAVWTVKRSTRDEQDKYIVVSSQSSTLVLAVGENVEEVSDSGFLGTTSTLVAINVGEDGLLQVFFIYIIFENFVLLYLPPPFSYKSKSGSPQWHPPHPWRSQSERMENSWQEDNRSRHR